MKTAELLIGQRRQNDRREQRKLGEGKNLLRGSTGGERLESDLQFQQQETGHAEGGGDPEMFVVNEGSDEVGRQARHF